MPGFYATIIDDFLTPAECDALKELASSTGEWQLAGLMAHATTETVHTSFRNSDRIVRVDAATADMIYQRLRPLVPELHVITPDSDDGLCDLLDGPTPQKSFVTLHLYLNGDVSGGATRFWTPDRKHFIDVEPKVGRVLVFQQRMLVHSGEVTEGIKYTMRTEFMFEQV
ncbi:hypothetical protein MVEN_00350800 [Mycena venus]|uniref:Prolyl 4-hydroxylase alpha subunit domain-containing protein n=1 Tax=Mycena venus TaxID=2733690 RepID=A0A8H6YTX6_9AGAR|nr:hypothetical protein MVEN_00350800 [Mycena venus]